LRRQENVSNPGTDRKGNEEEAFNKKKKGGKRKMRSPYLTYLIAVRGACSRFRARGTVGKRQQAGRTPNASRRSVAALPGWGARALPAKGEPARRSFWRKALTVGRSAAINGTIEQVICA
jgi:hypothetical protein